MFGGPAPPPERWLPAPRHRGKRSDHLLKNSIFLFSSFPLLFSSLLFSPLFSSSSHPFSCHLFLSPLLLLLFHSTLFSSSRRLASSRAVSTHLVSLLLSLLFSPLLSARHLLSFPVLSHMQPFLLYSLCSSLPLLSYDSSYVFSPLQCHLLQP